MSLPPILFHISGVFILSVGDFGKHIAMVRNLMMSRLDELLKKFDLTGSQYAVIKHIAEGRADTLAKLCELLQYDKGAMSRILSRMEDKSLIIRKPCPDDGRAFRLKLTPRGKELFPQTTPKVNALFEQALAEFTAKEKEAFFSMLERCRSNLS